MRKLLVNTFLTLDGVMQSPGGPGEDPTGGFTHEGWSVNYWDDQMGQKMGEVMGKPFALLLGRKTYEIFAAHWPFSTDEPAAAPLNNATKYVASRTLKSVGWQNSQLLRGDVAKAVAQLKNEDGLEIQVRCAVRSGRRLTVPEESGGSGIDPYRSSAHAPYIASEATGEAHRPRAGSRDASAVAPPSVEVPCPPR